MAKTKSDYGHIGDFRPTLVSSQEIDDMLGEALNDKKPGFFRRFKKRFLKSAISFFQRKIDRMDQKRRQENWDRIMKGK